MAYKYAANVPTAGSGEVFKLLRDFLCSRAAYEGLGPGWTLFDSYYASGDESIVAVNDWVVLYSPGENGNEELYFQITLYSTTALRVAGHRWWNATAHTGYAWYTSGQSIPCDGPTDFTWLYADKDFVFIITHDSVNTTRYWGSVFGCLQSPLTRTFHPLLATLTQTSNVPMSLADSAKDFLAVGSYAYIIPPAGFSTYYGRFQVVSNDGAGNIVANSVTALFPAGSKIVPSIPYVMQSVTTHCLSRSSPSLSLARGTSGENLTSYRGDVLTNIWAATDTDGDENRYASRIAIRTATSFVGFLPDWAVEIGIAGGAPSILSTMKLIGEDVNYRFFDIYNGWSSLYVYLRED